MITLPGQPAASPLVHRSTATFLAALLALTVGAGPILAEGELADPERSALAGEIVDMIRDDLREEALPLCRTFNDRYPGDPVMLYNQACLESTAGLTDQAAATFARAVEAGYDDFVQAFSDPDLEDLKYHRTLIELSLAHQIRLTEMASTRAVDLSWEETSAPVSLGEAGTDHEPGSPALSLTWTATGLEVELRTAGVWSNLVAPDVLAPWNGGPGLLVTLGLPSGSQDEIGFQTDNHFLFAFGTENDRPVGALFLSGQNRWQSVSEMQPKIRLDERGQLELRALIPWAGILPYDPVVDARMGLNAAVRIAGPDGDQTAHLLPDPAAFRPSFEVRRIVPLTFRVGSISAEVFTGKVSRTISGTEPITLDLVAVSGQEGPGRLTIDILGGPDQSLLSGGQVRQTVNLTPGLNHVTHQVDFSELKTGAYVVRARFDFPAGGSMTWGASVLQLAPDWRTTFGDRVAGLAPQEKPTGQFHLRAIEAAVASHPARRGPGAIVTAVDELGRLLHNADKNGSIFPPKGSFLVVYPGPDGTDRLCHAYLPAGWKIAKNLNPVVTLTAAAAMTRALADRMGQNYEQGRQKPTLKSGQDEGFPVYLVPVLAPPDGPRPSDLVSQLPREAEACLDWARETFHTPTVSVAGVDHGAAAALQLALVRPDALKAMIIFAGRDLEPWPQADHRFIRDQLAGFPLVLAVTWADFVNETQNDGQGPQILKALQDLGSHIVEVQTVRGGLNFTQASDRTVIWAEGLR